jgi:hypothetical protein
MTDQAPLAQSDHTSDAHPSAAKSGDALRTCYSDVTGGPYQYRDAFKAGCSDPKLPVVELTGDNKTKLQVASPNAETQGQTVKEAKDKPHGPAKHIETKDERLKEQAHKNGLTIRIVNGRYEYHELVNGKDQVAFTTDGTEDDANKQLHELVEKREAELTAKYGVQFAKKGETASFKDIVGYPKTDECREPTLKELEGLDAALSKNQYTPDGKPGPKFPKVYFLKDNVMPGFYAAFSYEQNAMFVMPGMAELSRATDKGTTANDETMEGELSHELNHWARGWENTQKAAAQKQQSDTGRNGSQPNATGDSPTATQPGTPGAPVDQNSNPQSKDAPKPPAPPPSNSAETDIETTETEKARYERLGWKELKNPSGDTEWAVEGKDHHFYVCAEGANGERVWIRVNSEGVPVDAKGNLIVKAEDDPKTIEKNILKSGVLLSDLEMRPLMKIWPITPYFTTPEEELSESESFFHTKGNRGFLARYDWALYLESKNLDQERINEANGVGPNGEPLYIRSPDGKIVPNDEAHRAEVEKFEEQNSGAFMTVPVKIPK